MAGNELDEALMALIAGGDQRAFRSLMEKHMARAIGFTERMVGRADADDIVQEAFLRVWARAALFDPGAGKFTNWLFRILVNLAIDSKRRPGGADLEEALEIPSPEPNAIQNLIAGEERRSVAIAMNRLPERQRAAILLFHMEGLNGREAAQVIGISEKAFESLLGRARNALKQEVEKPHAAARSEK
jgi:RNA polymerase sigma-70 factor (ECF subfamily)